jgi:protoporphyrinogen oxidase
LSVPYPLQNNLRHLDRETAERALVEMAAARNDPPSTMKEWLHASFGPTLAALFFDPFHQLYTAGLYDRIAPQDSYKSPVDLRLVRQGATGTAPAVGYNVTFLYPEDGLDGLARRLAQRADVHYGKRAQAIDLEAREVRFDDGTVVPYRRLISTLPLNVMLRLTGLGVDAPADPHTSVLVLNLGAVRGPKCPPDQWLYNCRTRAGFHRVGFYSNVDASFLPRRGRTDRVSIYVERGFVGGARPTEAEESAYARTVVAELQEWGFITSPEVVDPTWIDVAYTWALPRSRWRAQALAALEARDVYPVGRYGRWIFQGIADSIRDGLFVGGALRDDVDA